MQVNSKPSERVPLLGVLDPIAATAARTSAYVNGGLMGRLSILVLVGAASASAALTVLSAATSTGGDTAAVKSVAIGGTANRQFEVEINPEDMDPARPWYAASVAGGVAQVGVAIQGFDPRYEPGDQVNTVTVV